MLRTPVGLALLSLLLCLVPSESAAQIDLELGRQIVAQCPSPSGTYGGLPASFLCSDDIDRTSLDEPHRLGAPALARVHAGHFSILLRWPLLQVAHEAIGAAELARLQALLVAGQAISKGDESVRRALLREAQRLDDAGNAPGAEALRQQAAAIRAGKFDEAIPALLAARADRDRLPDLTSGLLRRLGVADTVGSYDMGLADDAQGSLGLINPAGGALLPLPFGLRQDFIKANSVPFFTGPDGRLNTADDLPAVSVATRPIALGAASVGSPFASTQFQQVGSFQDDLGNNLELYGVFEKGSLARNGCAISSLNGGNLVFNFATGGCSDPGTGTTLPDLRTVFQPAVEATLSPEQLALRERVYGLGCKFQDQTDRTSLGVVTGLNADGDCIRVNASASTAPRPLELLPFLGDPSLRPPGVGLEPIDLTDLRSFGHGARHPARPRSPSQNVSFPSADPNSFGLRVDPHSGAPLAAGGGSCSIRTEPDPANPGSTRNVGPDGVFENSDDDFPTEGNCLLFTKNATGDTVLRAPDEIAQLHTVNQTMFHTICTLTFDPDEGNCALDRLNNQDPFGFATDLLAGLGILTTAAIPGIDTLRRPQDGNSLTPLSSGTTNGQFKLIDPRGFDDVSVQNLSVSLQNEQKALLGCGPAYAAPCSKEEAALWAFDSPDDAANDLLNRDPNTPLFAKELQDGIDLMNAAGDVLTGEFALVKATRAGALLGTHETPSGLAYLPGMNLNRLPDPNGQTGYLGLTPADVQAMSDAERSSFAMTHESDGWVEPFPFALDEDVLNQYGALVFKARVANGQIVPADTVLAPNGGEYCAGWFNNPFDTGCTGLEAVSSNLERLLIGREVIGPASVFDAYETIAELRAAMDGFQPDDASADPIAGGDAIFAYNADVFGSTFQGRSVKDARVLELQSAAGLELDCPRVAGVCSYAADAGTAKQQIRDFVLDYLPLTECVNPQGCFAVVPAILAGIPVPRFPGNPIAAAFPISFPASDGVTPNKYRINLQALELLDPLTFAKLADENGALVDVPNEFLGLQRSVPDPVNPGLFVVEALPAGGTSALRISYLNLFGNQQSGGSGVGQDLDRDGITDLDRDDDGVWDGADDFTPGPISVSNGFCGSGIPGDLFQDAIQFEPAFADEAPGTPKFEAAFPDGLPPRSPVFCRSLMAYLRLVGEESPGRYAFLWHGGAQPAGTDGETDGWPEGLDNCPSVDNPDQADPEGDGVGSACDNCMSIPNARLADLAAGRTTTGGQLDDDADGVGNACDVMWAPRSASHTQVDQSDVELFKGAIWKLVSSEICPAVVDKGGSTQCRLYDVDGRARYIGAPDVGAFTRMLGRDPLAERCPACPLDCLGAVCGE